MGPAHFTAARYLRADKSNISRMRVIGLVTTSCADRAVTDSAAAATAYATGNKTNYEMLSVSPSGAPMVTALELAEKAGKSTGLVTTTDFYDATPAAFAAHSKYRHNEDEIVPQILHSGVDVIAGGGLESFGKGKVPAFDAAFAGTNFNVIRTRAELDGSTGDKQMVLFKTQAHDRDNPDFPLPVLAKWAIDRLQKDPDGFFLLIEHEGTDSGSHANSSDDVEASLRSFDEAVGVALDFASSRNDTLVIVTGDHETGGARLSESASSHKWRFEWSTREHTATAIPIFAFGPGAEMFGAFQDNTDVGKKLIGLVP
jgi:alkaline phosphatase